MTSFPTGERKGNVSRAKESELKKLFEKGTRFILDTSAILAYLHGEEGGKLLDLVWETSAIPFMAMSELYYVTWQRGGKAEADRAYGLVKGWDVPFHLPDERIILSAARFKVLYRLGIADSYIAAFALINQAVLLTKDPDFEAAVEEIRIFQLD